MRVFWGIIALTATATATAIYAATNLVGAVNVQPANISYTAASKHWIGNGSENLSVDVDISRASKHLSAATCTVRLSEITVTGDSDGLSKTLNEESGPCRSFAHFSIPASKIWSDDNGALATQCKKNPKSMASFKRHVRVHYWLTSSVGKADGYVTANASGSLNCQ